MNLITFVYNYNQAVSRPLDSRQRASAQMYVHMVFPTLVMETDLSNQGNLCSFRKKRLSVGGQGHEVVSLVDLFPHRGGHESAVSASV